MRMWMAGAMMMVATAAHAEWMNLPILKGDATAAPVAATTATGFASARIRILDKQTNRVEALTLKAKAKATSGALELVLNRCAGDLQGVPGQDAAWLDVRDTATESSLFSGWMFSSAPQVASLDHPRYDIQIVGCGDAPRGRVGSKAVVTDVGGAEDDEAPAAVSAEPAKAGEDDPYFVEGVQKKPAPASDQDQLHQLMDE